jgi:hypothetical protein
MACRESLSTLPILSRNFPPYIVAKLKLTAQEVRAFHHTCVVAKQSRLGLGLRKCPFHLTRIVAKHPLYIISSLFHPIHCCRETPYEVDCNLRLYYTPFYLSTISMLSRNAGKVAVSPPILPANFISLASTPTSRETLRCRPQPSYIILSCLVV